MSAARPSLTPVDSAMPDLARQMRDLGERARSAAGVLAISSGDQRNAALKAAAARIRTDWEAIADANAKDLETARSQDATPAFLDRLTLNRDRIEAMARSLEEVATQPDPLGREIARWTRPNGLDISRVTVPLGVIAIIYESRPNVTADAGGLCIKSGNAAILRGGSESLRSSRAIARCLSVGLAEARLPEDAVQLVPTADRAAVGMLLGMSDLVDVVIPRGGKSLIARVAAESRIPVLKHLDGICHVYVDRSADPKKAVAIAFNAKMRRTGVCGAAETLLVDRPVAETILPLIDDRLAEAGCELRGDEQARAIDGRLAPASEDDWSTEYLDAILSIRIVDGVDAAIDHINRYGSHHTDSIVAEDEAAIAKFFDGIDSAILLSNASTQFADGGEFGMGAEIGISTGKLHARGPVGADQLTSYKYLVRGSGQTRP